jgi:hypothetical protein
LVTRVASPPSRIPRTKIWEVESSSRLAENAIYRPTGLHSTLLSPLLVLVRRRGAALPSVGTSQRSLT